MIKEDVIPAFFTRAEDEPHKSRCRQILKSHPEVTQLIGRNPWTFVALLLILTLQLGLAMFFGLKGLEYWWVMILTAYAVGAFTNHCLYVIIHEATHNLIFKSRTINRCIGVLCDIPNVFPGALAFRNYHLKHHAHMGDHDFDGDLPLEWEARIVKNSPVKKAIWLAFFPVIQVTRSLYTQKVKTIDKWVIINLITVVVCDVILIYFFGWNAFFYLLLSMFFGLGLHPVGARWIQEHFTLVDDQETYSYYGWLNKLSMNVGYHNEHHDFTSIPWNRLPKLRAMAPEYYDTLIYHESWTKLLLNFIFDRNYTLHSRIVQEEFYQK